MTRSFYLEVNTEGTVLFVHEVPEDYWKFIRLLDQTIHPKDEFGHLLPPRCTIYAYCLMSNHVHLLIREGQEGIAAIIRSIGIAYAIHFNHSYQHKGHLFQDRYKSAQKEPSLLCVNLY